MSNPYLKSLYTKENALQAINADVARIEKETGIRVIRAHLGNPLGPQLRETDRFAADYYQNRHIDPGSKGYEDVAGDLKTRQEIAGSLMRINRLPEGSIDRRNIVGVTGGTGALNVAMAIFENPTILAPEPFYPPWMEIAKHLQRDIQTFPLRREDSYLLNPDILEKAIAEAETRKPGSPVVLMYHYPSNPTGKTLSEQEARDTAKMLNALSAKHPGLHLVQEDLYLATTASELGIYTPLSYLDDQTRQKTMWLVSASKAGHAQDRGAILAAFDKDMVKHIRGAVSFSTLGVSHPSLRLTNHTLAELAEGVDAKGAPGTKANNFRYEVADYYQERMKIAGERLEDMSKKLNAEILPDGVPGGAYYLYPSFECLRGKKIPPELAAVPGFKGRETFESADDVSLALANAHLLGLQPATVSPGTLFTHDKSTMHVRLATVEPDLSAMYSLANTLAGVTQKVTGVDLGARFHTPEELKGAFPVNPIGRNDHPVSFTFKHQAGGHNKNMDGFVIRY